jgi:hypothetical protein
VLQAQKELSKLTSEPSNSASDANPSPPAQNDSDLVEPPPSEAVEVEAEADPTDTPSSSEADTPLAASTSSHLDQSQVQAEDPASSSLLSRLQSAFPIAPIPSNIVSTVHSNLPDTLKHAADNIDLAQLRATLSSEFHRVQGATLAHAGGYVQKSEVLLREAMKEAGEVLRDAVKVIPPEEQPGFTGASSSMVWDGSDIWTFPTPVVGGDHFADKGKGREGALPSSSGRMSGEAAQRALSTRAELLLKQLKHNPEIIKHDPEADDVVKGLYLSWLAAEVESKEGGILSEEWTKEAEGLLSDPADGAALRASQDTLGTCQFSAFGCIMLKNSIDSAR